jgi:hypothetical protein
VIRSLVGGAAQEQIGVHRVVAKVLKVVGPQFIEQPDSPAFLPEINQRAASGARDFIEGHLQLACAVASQRSEHLTCEALGVDTRQDIVFSRDIAQHKSDVLMVCVIAEKMKLETAEFRWDAGLG